MLYANDSLHVWLKEIFFEGVLSVLEHTGFLEPEEAATYWKRLDIKPLAITDRSNQ